MTQEVSRLLEEAEQLSTAEKVELTERLVESLGHEVSPEVAALQLAEVRRRIAEVESGQVALVAGDEALARVRASVVSGR